MAKFEKRLEARRMRKEGKSINFIASFLKVSKSSASIWCRDLELTKKQKENLIRKAILAGHRGRIIGAEMNRKKKQEQIRYFEKQGKIEIGKLSNREFLVAGVALYWAEGSKKSKLSFINSDPELILFMYRWFKKIMGVKKKEFMPRIFINEIHRPRIKRVLEFWAKLLRLPEDQFRKTILLKAKQKKVYENYNFYYGTLAFGVRNSAKLKYRILGLINALN